ncbi:MAG TPA: RNA methyltransferase [bacterium]|nr:RNA methyltransferase [bacterium]
MLNVTRIESVNNPQARELAALSTRKGRAKAGCFAIDGVRMLEDALKATNVAVRRVAALESLAEDKNISRLLGACSDEGAAILLVAPQVMSKISRMETSQGIVAEVSLEKMPKLGDVDFEGASVIAHAVRDPRNMGMLARTCEAAGAGALFAPSGATDPFHPIAAQTSMGAVFYHKIVTGSETEDIVAAARKARPGIAVIGAATRAGVPIADFMKAPPRDLLLVLGNEGAGLDSETASLLDSTVTIPIFGRAESLNVSVAAGLILYLHRLSLKKK